MNIESKRNVLLALYLSGKSNQQIVRELCIHNANKSIVSRTMKQYKETGSVRKHYGCGRKPTSTATQNDGTVWTKEICKKACSEF